MSPPNVEALVFDVPGTLLDFCTPVRAALAEALRRPFPTRWPTPGATDRTGMRTALIERWALWQERHTALPP